MFLGTEAQSPMATLLLESPEEPWADARAQHVITPARNHSQEETGMWPHLEEESRAGLG